MGIDSSTLELRATVRQAYRLSGKRLLMLEDNYEGGIEAGDWVEVTTPGGLTLKIQVESVAWGSAFKSLNPPMTLVCVPDKLIDPEPGSKVRGLPPAE